MGLTLCHDSATIHQVISCKKKQIFFLTVPVHLTSKKNSSNIFREEKNIAATITDKVIVGIKMAIDDVRHDEIPFIRGLVP